MLVSEEDWEAIQETLFLRSVPGMRESIREGMETPVDECAEDPFRKPPPFEKLVGDLAVAYSRRINIQQRLVYQVLEEARVIKVLRQWSHYEQCRAERLPGDVRGR